MKKLATFGPALGLFASIVLATTALAASERDPKLLGPLAVDVDSKKASALEPITVVDVQRDDKRGAITSLKINAMFGGCGRAQDFRVDIDKRGGVQHVTIVRTKPDPCELYAANGTTFIVKVAGLDFNRPIVVDNPLFVGDE